MTIDEKEYTIDRANAKVRKWDKVYCKLLKKILKEGELFENRTGIDTYSIEGFCFKLDVGKEFPVLETKKVVIHNALTEMLWIHQAQTNNVSWLHERGNKIWDEWRIDDDGIYRIYDPKNSNPNNEVPLLDLDGNEVLENGKPVMIKAKEGKTLRQAKLFGLEYSGTIGTAYGFINNKYKRPQYVLYKLKTDPHDRRMNISLWQDGDLKTAVLPSCVWSIEFKVCKGKLHGFVHQRSADVPLGLPFNVSQYAILLAMFAKVSGLEVGNLSWSIMDAHIYVNQLDGIKTQLRRYEKMLELEKIIKKETDEQLQARYESLKQRIELATTKEELKELEEELMLFELMVTKTQPVLELADKDDFFAYNNVPNTSKEYLAENITGNEEIKVLRYKSAPYIPMPIAQ